MELQQEGTYKAEDLCKTKGKFVKYSFKWTIHDFEYTVARSREAQSSQFSVQGYPMQGQLILSTDDDENYFDPEFYRPDGFKYLDLNVKLHTEVPPRQITIECSLLDSKGHKHHIDARDCWSTCSFNPFVYGNVLFGENLISNDTINICCDITITTDIETKIEGKSLASASGPQHSLASDLAQLVDNPSFCDVTITIGERKFYALKMILTARSSVFAAMFRQKMKESKEKSVDVTHVTEEVFEEVLHFIYTDVVKNLDTMARELLDAAEKYDLKKLKILSAEVILKQLNVDNAAETLVIADRYNIKEMKNAVLSFISSHRKVVVQTSGFKALEETHVQLTLEVFKSMISE